MLGTYHAVQGNSTFNMRSLSDVAAGGETRLGAGVWVTVCAGEVGRHQRSDRRVLRQAVLPAICGAGRLCGRSEMELAPCHTGHGRAATKTHHHLGPPFGRRACETRSSAPTMTQQSPPGIG